MKKSLIALLILASSICFAQKGGNTYPPSFGTTLNFGPVTFNVTQSKIHIENAGSGDNDLFTAPVGFKAICIWNDYNTAGTTTTFFQEVKISGVYYRVGGNGTRATTVAGSSGQGVILEPGDSCSINYSQAGMNISGTAFVFPATSGLKTARILTGITTGDNTIYTCPAGLHCTTVLTNSQFFGTANAPFTPVVSNTSGGALSFYFNIVTNGGSPGTGNKALVATSVANLAILSAALSNWTLNPGDFISVNSTGTSNSIAVFLTVFEQ